MKHTLSNTIALLAITGLVADVEAKVKPLKVLGGSKVLADLGVAQPHAGPVVGPRSLEKRVWKKGPDKTKMKCGPGVGSCDPGYCCSFGGHW